MSNDNQLMTNQGYGLGLPMQSGGWGGPMGAAAAPPPPNPLKKMHRLLRGRYIVAGVLASLFAVAFAAAGFLLPKPQYKSSGLIEIDPSMPNPTDGIDKLMQMQMQFMQSQQLKLKTDRVIQAAMQSPEWTNPKWTAKRPLPSEPGAMDKFVKNLTIGAPPRTTSFIEVDYADKGKDAIEVAPVAVKAVMNAYKSIYGDEANGGLDDKIHNMSEEQKKLEQMIFERRNEIEQLAKEGGTDDAVIKARDEEVIKMESTIRDLNETLKQAMDDQEEATKASGGRRFSAEDFARVDARMAAYFKEMDEMSTKVDALKNQLGPNHPVVQRAQVDLDSFNARVNVYLDEMNQKFVIRWRADGYGGALIPRDLTNLKASIARMSEIASREHKAVSDMRGKSFRVAKLNSEIMEFHEQAREAQKSLRDLIFMRDHVQHIKFISYGDAAVIDKDRRPIFAALGFMGGAGLPIGLMLLIGMFDSRYRYSDEANTEMQGLTLLGILPNLPDRLSDPEQAAVAAHCVHQIRTMLQINGGPEDRRVFAVTSASPGDGKTSLTLALGLSYAACGTRTLLIDCDLIGAGLTARMNVSAAEGVLEAIANRSLLPYVRTTDIADVAILPVGSAGNLHASTLSPAALRRLIEEAEKHFETVLIDTGPILGSIEASLVCAAADAVILTVARGQQRPMVEKSLSHLTAIGARLAGVVFNRAQANDFERSISGVSMRSVGVPNTSRPNQLAAARLGSVAAAVVSGQDETEQE